VLKGDFEVIRTNKPRREVAKKEHIPANKVMQMIGPDS